MKIAVIDDERPARSELIHQLSEVLQEAEVDLQEIDIEEGESGAEALQMAEENTYDLLFLDINLGDINGTVLVNAIKNMQPGIKIIFVTAYSEYAVKAFELGVEDYVMKPYDKKRLKKVLKKCMETEAERPVHQESGRAAAEGSPAIQKIPINTGGKTIFESVENLVYIETYNRGCQIHTVNGDYYEGKSIGEFEKKLESMGFFRCQKSYLINLSKVKEMFLWKNNSFAIKMEGYEEHILPVGREKIKTLRQLLGVGTG